MSEAAKSAEGKELKDVLDVNLYSRQIYALGQTAMFRLRSARVLVSGLGSIGVEVAKNLVLGGVRHVTLHDTKNTETTDLSAQFYLNESHVGKNRAESCFAKIEELNDSVSCTVSTSPLSEEFVKDFDVIVVTDMTFSEQCNVNAWARAHGRVFISSDLAGLFGYVFTDLGEVFRVEDVDGENAKEVWLEHINTETGDVSTLDGALHGFSTDDYVEFFEIKGCNQLNGHPPVKITVNNRSVFNIGTVAKDFDEYIEGGRARQVKMPFEVKSKTLKESLADPTFLLWDFLKFDSPNNLHALFQALYKFVDDQKRRPMPFTVDEGLALKDLVPSGSEVPEELLKLFAYGSRGNLQPVASVLGGITAQEVMKTVTHHTTPQNGFLYIDNIEALPTEVKENLDNLSVENFASRGSRYDGQAAALGWEFVEKVKGLSPFIVGAGAIGCELLKNYAMMGVGTAKDAKIKITDMDQIEVSNLNRQFLFRRNDVGGKKSECASRAVKGFNNEINIVALADRVAEDTESIFNDDFFADLDVVTNALDNVDARRYMDRRCVYYLLPLLESGTMGTKGNTQVVYPHITESYSSSNDPPEKDIPICTLKNFPYEIQHTIQWARDTFQGLFTNPAETTNQFVSDERGFLTRLENMTLGQRLQMLTTVKRALVDEMPKNYEDCVRWARELFQNFFFNQIAQLLHNFPADQLTSSGAKFWSGTKRCPHTLKFDPNDSTHFDFVYAAAFLRAQQYRIEPITDRKRFLELVNSVSVKEFVPKSGVKIAVTDAEENAAANNPDDDSENAIESLKLSLARLRIRPELDAIDFEKDDDTNHHMEFITACSNLRAANYDISPSDMMQTKQIAGRIIPALATTTAVVAGLVAIELYKVADMKGHADRAKPDRYKSGFVNLALPLYAFSEPIGAPKKKFGSDEKTFTLWDRIEIDGPITLHELMEKIQKDTSLSISMISSGVSLLYAFFSASRARDRLNMEVSKVVEDVSRVTIPPFRRSIVLEVAATDDQDEDVEIPFIKYNIRK